MTSRTTFDRRAFLRMGLGTLAAGAPKLQAGTPQITAVSNAAYGTDKLAACGWASVYGNNLAGIVLQAQGVPLPTNLADTAVYVQGREVPLLYISPGQINVQIPCDLGQGPVNIGTKNNGQFSNTTVINLEPAAPGIFRIGAYGLPAAQRYPDNALPGLGTNLGDVPTSPLRAGDTWSVYLTGLPTEGNPIPTGKLAGLGSNGNAISISGVQAFLNNQPITTLNAAWNPGLIGVQQAAIKIPDTIVRGVYELSFTCRGVTSTPASLPVAGDKSPFAAGAISASDGQSRIYTGNVSVDANSPGEAFTSGKNGMYIAYQPGRPTSPSGLDKLIAQLRNPECYSLNDELLLGKDGNALAEHFMIPSFQDKSAHFKFNPNPASIDKSQDPVFSYFTADPNGIIDLLDYIQWAQIYCGLYPGSQAAWNIKFPVQPGPIKVYLNRDQAPSELIPALELAIGGWDRSGQQRFIEVAYDPTVIPGDAGVIITYVASSSMGSANLLTREIDHMIQGKITIGTFPQKDLATYSKYTNLLLIHELGHILGLPHSPSIYSIMYPTVPLISGQDELSFRVVDVNLNRPAEFHRERYLKS